MYWIIGITIYIIVGLLVGYTVYWQVKNLRGKKLRYGSIAAGVLWPVVFGLLLVMFLEDVRDTIREKNERY